MLAVTVPVEGSAATITGATCGSVTISPAPQSPSTTGTSVTFTAAGSCPNPNPLYEFWIRPANVNVWHVAQPYSTATMFPWSTGGLLGGYYVSVWAKDSASTTQTFDANATTLYSLKAPSCASVTLSPSSPSPQTAGTWVVFTAYAAGCSDLSGLYEYWMRPAAVNSWHIVQAYSADGTFSWYTTGSGGYYISVWAKDTSSPAPTFDANATVLFTINSSACTAVTLSVVVAGNPASFFSSASGCANPSALYEFWARPGNSSTWTVICPYSTTDGCTMSAAPGGYYISVWVKDAASGTSNFDVNATIGYLFH